MSRDIILKISFLSRRRGRIWTDNQSEITFNSQNNNCSLLDYNLFLSFSLFYWLCWWLLCECLINLLLLLDFAFLNYAFVFVRLFSMTRADCEMRFLSINSISCVFVVLLIEKEKFNEILFHLTYFHRYRFIELKSIKIFNHCWMIEILGHDLKKTTENISGFLLLFFITLYISIRVLRWEISCMHNAD